jgi:hypothetical protein
MTDHHPTTRPDRWSTTPTVDHPTGRLRRAWSALTTNPTDHPYDRAGIDHPTNPPNADPTTAPDHPTTRPVGTDRLRLVPPVAALGTAFVLQTIAVTDTVGGALAQTLTQSPAPWLAAHAGVGYLAALVLGIAVASCAEGGAAYLMDLYDKHLLARDSVWMLRLAMIVYVSGSGAAIHWWTSHRHLPEVTSWLLAGMSASALFLWSRGSRWRNRVAMRDAGQLDPALPKLPMAAKVWHPIRWLNTVRLVSWDPAATTDEARARYDEWRQARSDHPTAAGTDLGVVDRPEPTDQQADQPTGRVDTEPTAPTDQPPRPTGRTRPATNPTGSRSTGPTLQVVGGRAAVANAAKLRDRYGTDLPTSGRQIRADMGWSKERVDRAVAEYRAGTDLRSGDEPQERVS